MADFKREREEAAKEALAAANTHKKNGRLKDAASIYSRVLGLDPDNLEALEGMGEIASVSDTPQAALPIYAKILHLDPENINALNNRGIHLMSIGDAEASEFSFRKLLKIMPDDIDGLNNLGTSLMEQKRYEEAVEILDQAISLAPNSAQAYYNRGVVEMISTPDNQEPALRFFNQAIKVKPDHTKAHINIASIYSQSNLYHKSITHLDKALLADPNNAVILFNKGLSLRMLKLYSDALDCFKTAREGFPKPHLVDFEIGETNYQAGDLKTATAFFLMSVSENVSFTKGFTALGKSLAESGQLAKAKEAFERAGEEGEAFQRLKMLNILIGEEDPWESLKESFEKIFAASSSVFSKWDGQITNDCLYVHTAGMPDGEIVLLSRLLDSLNEKSNETVVLVKKPMLKLIARINGDVMVSDEQDFKPDETSGKLMTTHLYAAPSLLKLKSGQLPENGRYLEPDTAVNRSWDQNIFSGNELKIGLSWFASGLSTGPQQELRLEEFEPIMGLQGAKFISISPTDTKTQKNHLSDLNVENIGDAINDYEDLAAAIDQLDILISADNISAHIAGALHKPLLVLLPLLPSWVWGYKSRTVPYYPTATLIRQAHENNWDRPIKTTVQLLREKYGLA